MQKLRIGNTDCLTFFNSGANAHLTDGELAKKEKLQRISENHSALGVIGGGTITTESVNFRFNLGSGKDGICHEIKALRTSLQSLVNMDWRKLEKNLYLPPLNQRKIIFY